MYPGLVSLSGNTGHVDIFTLVTGLVVTFLEGNKLICFALQASIAVMPSQLEVVVAVIGEFLEWAHSKLDPLLADLDLSWQQVVRSISWPSINNDHGFQHSIYQTSHCS